MRICYVDEAGCTGALPSSSSDIQPVFILCGVSVRAEDVGAITHGFLHLKRRFFPNLLSSATEPYLAWVLPEIKGADLRKQAVSHSRRQYRHARGFLDSVVRLLEDHDARLYGRVWVKGIAQPFNGRSVYTYSLQYICEWFNRCLLDDEKHGIVVADSRNKALNSIASHSVFTQKFRAAGDRYPRLVEMPTFGHSENHVGVQLADLICSGILYPMAVDAYCRGTLKSVHARDYSVLRTLFATRIESLQRRCVEPLRSGRLAGGIMVDDKLGHRVRKIMFSSPSGPSTPASTVLTAPEAV